MEAPLPRVGLTDTLYPQLRTMLRALGAEPVELGVEAAFFAPAIAAVERPQASFRVRDVLLKGRWPARHAELPCIEEGEGADRFVKSVLDHRRSGGDPLDPEFLSAFMDLDAVALAAAKLDGILVAGGEDLEPAWYGEENAGSGPFHRSRDLLELAFLREALLRDIPLFCLCRGSQVLNAALGGSLHQDLGRLDPFLAERHASREESVRAAGHLIRVKPGSALEMAMGVQADDGSGTLVNVNSYHHQGYKGIGRGLEALAWDAEPPSPALSEPLAEALFLPERRFVLGVQWHPERPRAGASDPDPLALRAWDEIQARWRPGDERLMEAFMAVCRGRADDQQALDDRRP